MGTDAAEGLTAVDPEIGIQQSRERLSRDLAVLQTRLPDRDTVTKAAALSAGGAAAAVGSLWFAWSRHQRAKQRRDLVTMLREAGLEAVGDRTPTDAGGWRVLLGAVVAGMAGAGAIAASRRTLDG